MIKFDVVTKQNTKEHNPNWPRISNHSYRILITGGSGSRKTDPLLNLINPQPDIDIKFIYILKIYVKQNINC